MNAIHILRVISIVTLSNIVFTYCLSGPALDLAPKYNLPKFVVPDSWNGSGPFIKAKPSDDEIREDWWKLFNDPVLNQLEEEAMTANADLQASAERFLQARDMMLKVRSKLIPNIGIGVGASNNKQSEQALFKGTFDPTYDKNITMGSLATWEPDFWSAIRNETWAKIYEAESVAAEYALAKLSLQSELATNYFTLRGLEAQDATYRLSIEYYKQSLKIVESRFKGGIAPQLDIFRAQYLLSSTEAKRYDIQSQRKVIENAIAVLINRSPSTFKIEPQDELMTADFKIPAHLPANLLERRPDVAAMERKMARANREIGIAKAAFFPNVSFNLKGGFEGGTNLFSLSNGFWSYGAMTSVPLFQGGYRRAQLQQAWSQYRETEDRYRSTVLNAFREVENGLAQTYFYSLEVEKLNAAVETAVKTQDMTTQLYTTGLSNSLELLYAQLSTLTSKIDAIQVKTNLLNASVSLIRSLGGGWTRKKLPKEDDIQPMDIFEPVDFTNPKQIKGIEVNSKDNTKYNNFTKPSNPAKAAIEDNSKGK